MKDVLVLAPSAGRSRVRSHLHSTSLWFGQHLSRLTAQHDASRRLTVGSKIIHKTRACPEESQRREDRKCEGPGTATPSQGIGWVVFIQHTPTPSLFDTHRVTHCPRYQPSVQYTHKLCSHPPLPLIQCSNSTLFCNTVTQSHQLFIKDFCTCSVIGLINTDMELKGEEVKDWYNFPKMSMEQYI